MVSGYVDVGADGHVWGTGKVWKTGVDARGEWYLRYAELLKEVWWLLWS